MRVGLIGCGFISYAHLMGWKANGCEIAAVCDLDEKRLNMRAEEFQVKGRYTDVREMLENEKLDIIDIATPVKSHKALISVCCKYVSSILCEKPFVDNIEDGRFLVRECRKYGCKAMVCQSYRWHPWYESIKEILEQGLIGKPYYANIMQRISFDIPSGKERSIPLLEDQPFYENVEKLMLLEQGCHYLDMFRYLFGEPCYVQGIIGKMSPYVLGDDLAVVTIKFPDTVAVLEDLWCVNGQQKTSVTFIQGEKGSIYFDGTDGAAPHRTEETGNLRIEYIDGRVEEWPMDAKDYYNRCFAKLEKHFVDCIESGTEPMTSIEDNLKTLEVAFKAYESSDKKKALFLGE